MSVKIEDRKFVRLLLGCRDCVMGERYLGMGCTIILIHDSQMGRTTLHLTMPLSKSVLEKDRGEGTVSEEIALRRALGYCRGGDAV